MSGKNDRDRVLIDLGDEILAAMETVSKSAAKELSSPTQGASIAALAVPSNRMVGEAKPERFMMAMNAEQRADLARLLIDPFIARVEVEWSEGSPPQTTYYFARRSAAGLIKVIRNAAFVPSGGKFGALAEYEDGEVATIEINGKERKGLAAENYRSRPPRRRRDRMAQPVDRYRDRCPQHPRRLSAKPKGSRTVRRACRPARRRRPTRDGAFEGQRGSQRLAAPG